MFVGGINIYTVYGKEAVIINSAVHMFFVLSVSRLASELFLNFRNMKTAVINFIMHTFTILLILAFLYFFGKLSILWTIIKRSFDAYSPYYNLAFQFIFFNTCTPIQPLINCSIYFSCILNLILAAQNQCICVRSPPGPTIVLFLSLSSSILGLFTFRVKDLLYFWWFFFLSIFQLKYLS